MNIPFPEKGLSEGRSNDEQPPLTARDGVNVRSTDPITERIRGARRSGLSEFVDTAINGTNKIADLAIVQYDQKNTTYSNASVPGTTWSEEAPGKNDSWQVVTDRQSNAYFTDPKGSIIKRNSAGAEVWKLSISLANAGHEIRSLAVDDSDWVYAGVSTGGELKTARLFAYEQTADNKTNKVWEFDAGGYIEKIFAKDGRLFLLVNNTDTWKTEVVVLSAVNTAVPEVERRFPTSYPGNDLWVSVKDGSIFTAHEPNTSRGLDPRSLDTTATNEDWTPKNLTSWQKRIWCWLKADDIDGDGTMNSAYEDGETINAWYDQTDNNRNLYTNTFPGTTELGPTLRKGVHAGKDVLVFNGINQSMMSGQSSTSANPSTDPVAKASMLSLLPCYEKAQFVLSMVVRLQPDEAIRVLLGQDIGSTHAAATFRGIMTNRGAMDLGTHRPRYQAVGWVEDTTGSSSVAGANGGQPLNGFMGGDGLCSITVIHDGGVDDQVGNGTRSALWINGWPIDRWMSLDGTFAGTAPTIIGSYMGTIGTTSVAVKRLWGYICEIIVLSDWYTSGSEPLSVPTQNRLITHNQYPDVIWATGSVNELNQLVGYMHHRWGIAHKLPNGTFSCLQSTGTRPAGGEKVTINGQDYTFQTTTGTTTAAYDVNRGATAYETLRNLSLAINGTGAGDGTDYGPGTVANPDALAMGVTEYDSTAPTTDKVGMFLRSRSTSTTGFAVSDTSAQLSWTNATTTDHTGGSPPGTNVGMYPHPYYLKKTSSNNIGGPPISSGASTQSPYGQFSSPYGQLIKWDPVTGKMRWIATSNYDAGGVGLGAVGYGVAVSSTGVVFSVGPRQALVSSPSITADAVDFRGLIDNGDSYSTSSPGWSVAVAEIDYTKPRLDVDKFDNVFIPAYNTDSTNVQCEVGLYVYSLTGSSVAGVTIDGRHLCHSVAVDDNVPEYGTDLTNNIAESCFLAGRVENAVTLTTSGSPPADNSTLTIGSQVYTFKTTLSSGPTVAYEILIGTAASTLTNIQRALNNMPTAGTNYSVGTAANTDVRAVNRTATTLDLRAITPIQFGTSTVSVSASGSSNLSVSASTLQLVQDTQFKVSLVDSVPATGSPRASKILAVSGGGIYDIATPSTSTLVTSFASSLSQYIQSTTLRQKVFFTNGEEVIVYDPKAGTASALASTSAGEVPKRCKLIDNWRGRLILARGADDPHNWHMSAVDDEGNWDQFPPVITATQAISGNNSKLGRVPDIVNAVIPYDDDLLFFGGDHSIWRMTGDPMAGGQLDLVTDVTGIAFGHAWDKDDEGNIYFFGSRGGLYGFNRKFGIKKLSENKIDNRLRQYDLATYAIRVVWNDAEDCIHIFATPYGAGGATPDHYVWEKRTGAFWEDNFATVGLQPTAACSIDGDAFDDRVLLIGCQDGKVRKWDVTAKDDDGQAIAATVTIGPIQGKDEFETRMFAFNAVLASDQTDTVTIEIFATDEPDALGTAVYSGTISEGRNAWIHAKARGRYIYFKLSSANLDRRWAFENLDVKLAQAGRTRVR